MFKNLKDSISMKKRGKKKFKIVTNGTCSAEKHNFYNEKTH